MRSLKMEDFDEKLEIAKDVLDNELGTLYLIHFKKFKISVAELSRRQTHLIDKYTDHILKLIKDEDE